MYNFVEVAYFVTIHSFQSSQLSNVRHECLMNFMLKLFMLKQFVCVSL